MNYICKNTLTLTGPAPAPATTTTVYQDALARITAPAPDAGFPPRPRLTNSFEPTPADLLLLARYIASIAADCNIHAKAGEPLNPWACLGALRYLTGEMAVYIAKLAADEERALLLLDRLRHEHNQECAHEHLMATDAEYAEDFEADGDDE